MSLSYRVVDKSHVHYHDRIRKYRMIRIILFVCAAVTQNCKYFELNTK
jgi:hypothetical protein